VHSVNAPYIHLPTKTPASGGIRQSCSILPAPRSNGPGPGGRWFALLPSASGETGEAIAGGREFREQNNWAGRKIGKEKETNTYLVMPDPAPFLNICKAHNNTLLRMKEIRTPFGASRRGRVSVFPQKITFSFLGLFGVLSR